MSEEAFPRPVRCEPRGEFPRHSEQSRPLLSALAARRIARDRLKKWKAENE